MKYWPILFAGLCSAATAQNLPAPIHALVRNGVAVTGEMPAPHGYKGYIGVYQGDAIPIYLLPDGSHVLVGTLYDANGKDLTQGPFQAASKPGLDPALWNLLDHATWFAESASRSSRIVYVFTDTECRYCHQLWAASRTYLRNGRTQVRNIMVAVIAPESLGRGAAVLASADPASSWRTHERAFGHSPVKPLATVTPALRARMEANQALLTRFKAYGTPVTVYRDDNGKVRMVQGVPEGDSLRTIFGG